MSALVLPVMRVCVPLLVPVVRLVFYLLHICTCITNLYYSNVGM